MKTVLVALLVASTCFMAAQGYLRGAFKDSLGRTPTQVKANAATLSQTIAVEVNGDLREAGNIAEKCGLVFRGKVGNLDGIYHYDLAPPTEMDTAVNCLHKLRPMVGRVDPQTLRHMVPKED